MCLMLEFFTFFHQSLVFSCRVFLRLQFTIGTLLDVTGKVRLNWENETYLGEWDSTWIMTLHWEGFVALVTWIKSVSLLFFLKFYRPLRRALSIRRTQIWKPFWFCLIYLTVYKSWSIGWYVSSVFRTSTSGKYPVVVQSGQSFFLGENIVATEEW